MLSSSPSLQPFFAMPTPSLSSTERHRDALSRSTSSSSHRSPGSVGVMEPTPGLQDHSPQFTDSLLTEGLGLSTDFPYSMSSSPHGSTHSSFGFTDSTYREDHPPPNSLGLDVGRTPASTSSFGDAYTFVQEGSPIDTNLPVDLNFPGNLSRLNIPHIHIPASSSAHRHEAASPVYLGTTSPSTPGNSNNSPYTPSGIHSVSPHMGMPYLTPQTPYVHSPFLTQASMDHFTTSQHSPISPGFSVFDPHSPKNYSSYSYMATPISPMNMIYPTMDQLHPFEDPQPIGIQPMAMGQSVPQTVWDLAAAYPSVGVALPQRPYRPHTQSDRRRYVEEVVLEGPIMFVMQNPIGCGISCRDALNSKFMRLHGRDDQMFNNRGPSVSIRLMWPGYAPWSRQIPTRDFRTPPGPITRSKLAKNVAKTVLRFIDEMSPRPLEDDADPRWKVGAGHITIDDLDIVGLQHVSMGSWQVHLRVRSQPHEVYASRADSLVRHRRPL